MNEKKIKYICLGLLVVLIIFHIANNLYFLAKNPLAEGKDNYAHITAFSNFKQIIDNGKNNPFYIQDQSLAYNLIFCVIDYPPLFYVSADIIDLLLGRFLFNAALLTNTFYLILLLVSVYFIANRSSPVAGIISAYICGMYPMVFLSSRHFSLELALAAMCAVSILALIKTDGFQNRKFCLILGIFLGLGMLTKQTFLIYIAGPFGFYAYLCFFQKQISFTPDKRKLNLIGCLFVGILICSIFYCNKGVYLSVLNRAGLSGAVVSNDLYSFAHLSYYLQSLSNTIGYFFLVVLIGALLSLRKIEKTTQFILILWVLFPLFVFTFIKLKYADYTIAYLPALGLITGLGISSISKKFFRNLIIFGIITVSIFSYYSISWNKSKNFYSTYYPVMPEINVIYSQDGSYLSDKILENTAKRDVKIGIFYDNDSADLFFPAYFIRLTALNSQKKAQIVDFLFRSEVFWDVLADFEILIFVTCSDQQWITEESFMNFIEQINSKSSNQLKVKDIDIARLIELKEKLEKMHVLVFNRPENKENVYIYRKIK